MFTFSRSIQSGRGLEEDIPRWREMFDHEGLIMTVGLELGAGEWTGEMLAAVALPSVDVTLWFLSYG